MVGHIYRIAKRMFGVPDFRYYAIADGIMALFARHPGGVRPAEMEGAWWSNPPWCYTLPAKKLGEVLITVSWI